MALTAGDTTTQFILWMKANVATNADETKVLKPALATATLLPATTDLMVLMKTWIAR